MRIDQLDLEGIQVICHQILITPLAGSLVPPDVVYFPHVPQRAVGDMGAQYSRQQYLRGLHSKVRSTKSTDL
jgi:hypothetical protein